MKEIANYELRITNAERGSGLLTACIRLSIPLFTFTFGLHLALLAAVPLSWTVDMKRAQPATFEAYQGEVIAIEAALHADGKPFEAPSNYSLFWQTNGMGRLYWEAPCSRGGDIPVAATNVLFATWLPSYDVGAKVYNCFIGSPSNNYHTAFQLRLHPSPGALPNELPLPVPVIDFAKVRVLNPPWSGGGGGGVNTNAVIDIIHETVSGSARSLPKYLHIYNADDSYPDAAAEYYRSRGNGKTDGGCSAVRDGGFLSRNFDYPFDDRAEFVVRMSASVGGAPRAPRFASVGVAQVGTNITEQIVTSGKWSKWYKALPGATVDGINENGVVCEVNVVDGEPPAHTGGDIHPLGAVRWALDNGTSAGMVASNLAARIAFPQGWAQNFHWMIADERGTWIVENGTASNVTAVAAKRVMTNFPILPDTYEGEGAERYQLLRGGANITNAWYTRAYRRETTPPWVSDLREVLAYTNEIFDAWAEHPKEYFRGKTNNGIPWWQTVHTSVYDITNRTLRVAVQETDDWYTFQVPSAGGVKVETDPTVPGWAKRTDKPSYTAKEVGALGATYASTGRPPKATVTNGVEFAKDVEVNGTLEVEEEAYANGGVFTDYIYYNDGECLDINGVIYAYDDRVEVERNADFKGEITHDGNAVVYGISVNGGNPSHDYVYLSVPDVGSGIPGGGVSARYADHAGEVPTAAPTNRADYAGLAADARKTGIELTNRYTKAETDAKLAGKANKNGDYNEWFEASYLNVDEVSANGDISAGGDVKDLSGNVLSEKVDKPIGEIIEGDLAMLDADGNLVDSGTHYLDIDDIKKSKANMVEGATAGNLASLDENGDLADSGIGTNAVESIVDTYAAVSNAAMTAKIEIPQLWNAVTNASELLERALGGN